MLARTPPGTPIINVGDGGARVLRERNKSLQVQDGNLTSRQIQGGQGGILHQTLLQTISFHAVAMLFHWQNKFHQPYVKGPPLYM